MQTTQSSGAAVSRAAGGSGGEPLRLPEPPRWFTIWFVPLASLVMLVAYFTHRGFYSMLITKEGLVEWATVLILLLGIVAGFRGIRYWPKLPTKWLRLWLLLSRWG